MGARVPGGVGGAAAVSSVSPAGVPWRRGAPPAEGRRRPGHRARHTRPCALFSSLGLALRAQRGSRRRTGDGRPTAPHVWKPAASRLWYRRTEAGNWRRRTSNFRSRRGRRKNTSAVTVSHGPRDTQRARSVRIRVWAALPVFGLPTQAAMLFRFFYFYIYFFYSFAKINFFCITK